MPRVHRPRSKTPRRTASVAEPTLTVYVAKSSPRSPPRLPRPPSRSRQRPRPPRPRRTAPRHRPLKPSRPGSRPHPPQHRSRPSRLRCPRQRPPPRPRHPPPRACARARCNPSPRPHARHPPTVQRRSVRPSVRVPVTEPKARRHQTARPSVQPAVRSRRRRADRSVLRVDRSRRLRVLVVQSPARPGARPVDRALVLVVRVPPPVRRVPVARRHAPVVPVASLVRAPAPPPEALQVPTVVVRPAAERVALVDRSARPRADVGATSKSSSPRR